MSYQEEYETYQAQEEDQLNEEECQQTEEGIENIEQQDNLEEEPSEFDIDEVAPQIEVDELIAEYEMLEQELLELLPPDTVLALEEEETDVEDVDDDSDDNSIEVASNQSTLVLEVEVKTLEEQEDQLENIEQQEDLEEEPPEFDIDEKALQIEAEELLAEHEILEQELEEFLPPDTILTFEEAETKDYDEDIYDNSVDSIDHNMLVLEEEVEVQESQEEEIEICELIDTVQEIQEEGVESLIQHEVDISIENEIGEEIEEDTLDESPEIEFSSINQVTEELTADVDVIKLGMELESSFLEEELNTEQIQETEDEETKEWIHQEERLIEEKSIGCDTDWGYKDSGEQEYYDKEIMNSDTSETTLIEATEYEETTNDHELGYQTCEDDFEEIIELNEKTDTPDTVEITNIAEPEDKVKTQRLENPSFYASFEKPFGTHSIEITHSDDFSLQKSFCLLLNDENFHNFSIKVLDSEISALEKMLDEIESPRLLTQFHPQVEDNVQQLLDMESNQIVPEFSTELVSQGPALPEPPPYDFQAELEKWENESKKQAHPNHGYLIRSYEEAKRIQLAASYRFNSTDPKLSPKRQNTEHVKSSKNSKLINNTGIKNSPHLTLKNLENNIIELGKKITLKSSSTEITQYKDIWNTYIKKGGKITQHLKNNFNLVAANTNQNELARVKLYGHREWVLQNCSEIESAQKHVNKWIPNAFLNQKEENIVTKCRTGTILEWLKCRDKISINNKSIGEGAHKIYQKKSFYEIKIQSDDDQPKILFIPNKKTNWNPSGFQSENYSPSRTRKSQGAIANELLESISFHSLTTIEKKQIFAKMQSLYPRLKNPTQIPSRYIIYRPQKGLKLDLFDDILVTEFYKLYNSRGSVVYQRASEYTQELIEKHLKPVIKYVTTQTFAEKKRSFFRKTVTNKETSLTIMSRSRKHVFDSLQTFKGKKQQIKWMIKKEKSINNRIYQDKKTTKIKKHELIILGETISSNRDPSLIDSYIKTWNNHLTRGGIVDTDLKKNFDTILSKIGKDRLVRVKFRNTDGWLLKDGYDVKIAKKYVNKWIPNAFPKEETVSDSSRARINVILEWLKSRDKIKIKNKYIGNNPYRIYQIKSFYEIKVQNDNGQFETFYIANKNTKWNLKGYETAFYSPSTYGKSQSTIVQDLLTSVRFYSLTTNEKRQIFLEMQKIFPNLKKATQISSGYSIYELQRNLDLDIFDNLLITKFYDLYAAKSPSEIKSVGYNHIYELISKPPSGLIQYITNRPFSSTKGNFFKVVIVDREKAFNLFKEKLKRKTNVYNFSKQNQEFRKKMRELGLRRISMIYEKARLEVAEKVPSFHFTIENALEKGFEITDNYTDFWNEDHVDSFTGVAAGMMQHKDFRIQVLSKFRHLVINKNNTIINSEITGKDILPGGSISPDITVRKDDEIVEEVEVKQLRPIGRNLKDKTNPTFYWFDFFKTLETEGDPINHISLQFVSKQDDVDAMGWDCAKNGIGGVIVEAGEVEGLPKRLNEIITAFSYERWPSAHRIDKTSRTINKDLVSGIMERLKVSAKRKNQLREVITEEEVEEFVRDVHVFPKDYKQHRGYVEILIYILRKCFN